MRRRHSRLAHLLILVLATAVIVIGMATNISHSSAVSVIDDSARVATVTGDATVSSDPSDAAAQNLPPADGDAAADADPSTTTPVTEAPEETTIPAPQYSLSAVPDISGSGQRIVVANAANMLWVVASDGSIVKSWLVSGRDGVPYPGTYHTMSKARYTHGILGHEDISMEYATRFAISPNRKNTLDFHAIPVQNGRPMQSESQLGSFQSGGCVRMTMDHAAWIFNNIPLGYKVVVLR